MFRWRNALKDALKGLKDELDDHREAINENTNEIQSNYEYLCRLESKIDKLAERLDELTLFRQELDYCISDLTTREKEVFLALYTAADFIAYRDIGRRTGLTENLVICYISNLITKGVPVLKKYVNGEVRLALEPRFKELQMKKNIVGINQCLSQRIQA